MNWLTDLLDEYPTGRSDSAVERLARVFQDESDETMQAAVDAYMLAGERFFPKVGDLIAYVKAAQEQGRGPESFSQIKRARYGRWLSETGEHFSDDEIYTWEQARGSLPPLADAGTEWGEGEPPSPDPAALAAIRAAYQRMGAAPAI